MLDGLLISICLIKVPSHFLGEDVLKMGLIRPKEVFSVIIFLQDVLEDKKLLHFISYDKKYNRSAISLDFSYVLHHYNTKGSLIYLRDVTEWVRLREDKI